MKKLIALLLAVVMVFALAACGGSSKSDAITINIGHSDTTQNLIHISLEHFAKAVNERTNGKVTVVIHAAEELGSNKEMIEMVKMGNLDAMMLPSGQQADFCPKFKALSLPFLFADYDHVYRVLDGELGEE
ncbi:MAG: TRAP transporter substrate-binding protein DctP, partial [Oscillospiraceae bacterium]|nr:TRAP transporter substrate-binding protein DctP [Oscillospiraceae bacterium]